MLFPRITGTTAAKGRYTMTNPIIDPEHYRNCAGMARAKADRVKDVRFKRIMFGIAEVYEGLAERANSVCVDTTGAD